MKKLLIIFVLLISLPSYALCPVNTDVESICTITNYSSSSPIFKTTNADNNLSNQQENVQPMKQDGTLNNQIYKSNDSIMKYNSGCQFGICVQDLNSTKNQNQ